MSEKEKKRSKSREEKKKAKEEERERKKAEEEQRIAQEKAEAEEAKKKLPKDIMNQKGYYDTMMQTMADNKQTLQTLDEEIEQDKAEIAELEARIASMQKWLEDSEPARVVNRQNLGKLDRSLAELEDPDADQEALVRMLRFANLPLDPFERAKVLRKDYRKMFRLEALSAPFSITPRHGGGVEAVEITNKTAMCDGQRIPIRCYSPASKPFNSSPAPPAIVFFHGGGYVLGDLETHDWFCRSLSGLSGATVVAVDYRRAPEHQYPAALDDAYGALRWVADGGLGQVPKRLGVAGDDAGGGLAAACCLRARADGVASQISVQLLFTPWLDLRPESEAMSSELSRCREGLCSWECHWYREVYAPEGADPDNHGAGPWTEESDASPVLAESLADLPRAYVVYPVHSMLNGEAVRFVERLREEAGFEAVHTIRLEGPQHHFVAMANDHHAQIVLSAAANFASAVLWAP